jgi:MFS transporter, DHA2 family, multidrug resistance protein
LAFVALPFYFVDALGISQVKAGLLLTPWPIAAGVMSHFSGRLADRHSLRVLGTSGMLGMGAGMLLLAMAPAHPSTFDIVWRAALGGAGFGFFGAPNSRAMVASAPRERSGGAGGIATMSRIVGQSIGVSVVAVVFGIVAHGEVTLRSVDVALVCGACFALTSGAISTARLPHIQPE